METKIASLSQRYQVELQKYLEGGRQGVPQIADQLGLKALDLGLNTPDLARLHQQTLATLIASEGAAELSGTAIQRAHRFFSKAIMRLEKTHQTALQANTRLRKRREELAAANQILKKEIAKHHGVEKALKKSEQTHRQLLKQSHEMQEQLRHLSRRVLYAQEEERRRISIELHDEVAQVLTGINLHLATLTKGMENNTKDFKRKVSRTQRLVEQSLDTIHQFAGQLRPPALDDLGFIPALHSFVKDFGERTGLDIHVTSFTRDRIEQLDDDQRTVLFRIAQETLMNVAKHAQASLVKINIQKCRSFVCMEITDNGRSFQVDRVLSRGKKRRLGLIGMRERVEMIGGRFTLQSEPDHGTLVRAEIPWSHGVPQDTAKVVL